LFRLPRIGKMPIARAPRTDSRPGAVLMRQKGT
jgi:hypothetical protein